MTSSPDSTLSDRRPAVPSLDAMSDAELAVATIRTLAMDAVQAADSGHPGTPMALAPAAYVLWHRHRRHNPANPDWFDRDRFVLSAGHASMLQYALLHLSGYDLPLEELRDFRQWGSMTPGHPEAHETPGVETTTGPLGQGAMNSVGMAMAEAHLAARFNRPGHRIVDHRTYAICSDGDLMEGASHEAASLAGHLGLGKLVWLYDDNHITIDGDTDLAYTEDVAGRFRAYGWHVQELGEAGNDLVALDDAFTRAEEETDRPSLLVLRTHIAWGAPNKQDTAAAHGAPLGEEEIRATKRFYGWPEEETFLVPDRAREHMSRAAERGRRLEAEWRDRLERYAGEHPEPAAGFHDALEGRLPEGWDDAFPSFSPEEGPMATRAASGAVLDAFAGDVPWLVGGSADLTGSNKTMFDGVEVFSRENPAGRYVHWGVREHVMCGASSGMALHGGVRPYAGTFFVFTDYARPSIRLAAMMGLPVIYVLTHDSIGLGEDGPTHQPVEHLASFRAMPGVRVIRPADAAEVAAAWRVAMEHDDGPTMLILTRQGLPVFDRDLVASADGLRRGAYVLEDGDEGDRPDLILLATGSEVQLVVEAGRRLRGEGIRARAVSIPSWELFREQPRTYRDRVLPPGVRARLAVEAGATQGWGEWVGEAGDILGIDRFGASAPAEENFRRYGFTADRVVERARALLEGAS